MHRVPGPSTLLRSGVVAVSALLIAGTATGTAAAGQAAAPQHDTTARSAQAASAPRSAADGSSSGTKSSYRVRFTDVGSHPLADVHVEAVNYDNEAIRHTTSAADGVATLSLGAGEWFVDEGGQHITGGSSDATGYVETSRYVHVVRGRAIASSTVVLRPAGAVRVQVTDDAGHPVAGAHPTLAPVSPYVQADSSGALGILFLFASGSGDLAATTGADGMATIKDVPASDAFQTCTSSLPDPASKTDTIYQAACTKTSVVARVGQFSTATLALSAGPGGAVAGRVQRADGTGFRRAMVELVSRNFDINAIVRTGADGRFRVDGLPPGKYQACAVGGASLQVGHGGYQPGCTAHVIVVTAGVATATITLRPGAAIGGRVTGPHGAPVAGAGVEVQVGRTGGGYATTDSHGHYVVKGLSAGRGAVCADVDGVTPSHAFPTGVQSNCDHRHVHYVAHIGRRTRGVHVTLRAGALVSGKLVDKDGRAVSHALVVIERHSQDADDPSAESGAHGQFVLRGLASGRIRLCAVTIEPDGAGVHGCKHARLVLHAGHRIAGRTVVLPASATIGVDVEDEQGHSVDGVDAAAITACKRFCDGDFPLLPGKRVLVAATAVTRAGVAEFTGLPAGKYTVCLFGFFGATRAGAPATGYADSCYSSHINLAVHPGEQVNINQTLHPGGAVSGRITDEDGNPLAGVLVHVAGSAADDLPTSGGFGFSVFFGPGSQPATYSKTAADGTFTIRGVRPGQRLVCVSPAGASGGDSAGGYRSQCVGGTVGSTKAGTATTVTAGGTTSGVDLALTPGAAISGTLSVTHHKGDFGAVVVLFRNGKLGHEAQVNAQGAYHFARLASGQYAVCAVVLGQRADRGRCYRNAPFDPDATQIVVPASATLVTAQAGVDVPDIDFAVPR